MITTEKLEALGFTLNQDGSWTKAGFTLYQMAAWWEYKVDHMKESRPLYGMTDVFSLYTIFTGKNINEPA